MDLQRPGCSPPGGDEGTDSTDGTDQACGVYAEAYDESFSELHCFLFSPINNVLRRFFCRPYIRILALRSAGLVMRIFAEQKHHIHNVLFSIPVRFSNPLSL